MVDICNTIHIIVMEELVGSFFSEFIPCAFQSWWLLAVAKLMFTLSMKIHCSCQLAWCIFDGSKWIPLFDVNIFTWIFNLMPVLLLLLIVLYACTLPSSFSIYLFAISFDVYRLHSSEKDLRNRSEKKGCISDEA